MPCTCQYKNRSMWGSLLWKLLHGIPRKIVKIENVDKSVNLIKNFFIMLPCDECYMHAKSYLTTNPVVLSDPDNLQKIRDDFDKYIFNFHDTVNKRLKKIIPPEYTTHVKYKQLPTDTKFVNIPETKKIYKNKINIAFFDKHHTSDEKKFLKQFFVIYASL